MKLKKVRSQIILVVGLLMQLNAFAGEAIVQKYFPSSEGLVDQTGQTLFFRASKLENLIIGCFEIAAQYRGIGKDQTDYLIPICNSVADDYLSWQRAEPLSKQKLVKSLEQLRSAVFEKPLLHLEARDRFRKLAIGQVVTDYAADDVKDLCFQIEFLSDRILKITNKDPELSVALKTIKQTAQNILIQANLPRANSWNFQVELLVLSDQLSRIDQNLRAIQLDLVGDAFHDVRDLRVIGGRLKSAL